MPNHSLSVLILVFRCSSLFETVEDALKSAVDAGKDRSDAADTAFATAEEELDWYAAWHHPKQQWVPFHLYCTVG